MRIAESVLLTCCPPAPDARKVSMRSSAGLSAIVVDLLELGQDRDGAGRGVDAALCLGRRHALHAVRAGLELEPRVRALADDAADDLLVAAVLAGALAQHLDSPALPFGVARVHAEQVAREDRGLVAAGAGADLEEDVAVVARVLRDQQLRELESLRLRCARRDCAARPRRARASPRRRRPPSPRRSRAPPRVAQNSLKRAATGSSREYSTDRSRNRPGLAITSGSASRAPTSSKRSTVRLEPAPDRVLHQSWSSR